MQIENLAALDLGFDVVIIGAGAAGCALAKDLSKKYKVLLVDSKKFPRTKACSGIIVTEGQKYFGESLKGALLCSPKLLDIEYVDFDNNLNKEAKKDFVNSDRASLDRYLLDSVKNMGNISFIDKTLFLDFTQTKDNVHKVVMLESNGQVKPVITKYLVGCDGAISRVRKKIFSREIPFYIGIQEFIPTDVDISKAYFIFDDSITDYYSWIIPKKPLVEIGGLFDPKNSSERYAALKTKLAEKYKITGTGKLNSAIVLRPSSMKDICLGKDDVLLCGEAAGLISPSSAEGISYALRSGKACAEAFNSGKNPLKQYILNCDPILKRLEKKFAKAEILSNKSLRRRLFS